ncbi:unnamed protein product [Meloidogyne enterolobii]|uniref:Uncharacterized protein n=1 Tax=Meloidogyne enterolobii TaxID=390850 RepID=A0ACB1B182_MELEN
MFADYDYTPPVPIALGKIRAKRFLLIKIFVKINFHLFIQIVLVIVVLIVGCLFLCCMLGVFWYLYSKRNERTESSNVQYYPYYVPPATRIGKDGELGTQFR